MKSGAEMGGKERNSVRYDEPKISLFLAFQGYFGYICEEELVFS